jgi:hypothetical protein
MSSRFWRAKPIIVAATLYGPPTRIPGMLKRPSAREAPTYWVPEGSVHRSDARALEGAVLRIRHDATDLTRGHLRGAMVARPTAIAARTSVNREIQRFMVFPLWGGNQQRAGPGVGRAL